MVTNSKENYVQYKKDVFDMYNKKFPQHKKGIKNFVEMISKAYDEKKRVYFPYKLMFYLFGKRNYVKKKNQHYWIAFIGKKGGEGKSTLCGNMLYFLDNTFNEERVKLTYKEFISIIPKAKKENRFPSIQLDEPENKIHVLSWKGRQMRDILEKIRQLNLFVGVCANSLTSVPSFIYDRLDCIIYLENFRFWAWDNQLDKPRHTIISDIKKEFVKKGRGHGAFKDKKIIERAFLKNQCFSKDIAFSTKEYIKEKKKDLIKEIKSYATPQDAQEQKTKITTKDMIYNILQKNPKISNRKLCDTFNIPIRTVQYHTYKYKEELRINKKNKKSKTHTKPHNKITKKSRKPST